MAMTSKRDKPGKYQILDKDGKVVEVLGNRSKAIKGAIAIGGTVRWS